LDVESRERVVGERFEPALDGLEGAVLDERLSQCRPEDESG